MNEYIFAVKKVLMATVFLACGAAKMEHLVNPILNLPYWCVEKSQRRLFGHF